MILLNYDALLKEAQFSFARSGGKGGQHVNKTETKAELYFSIPNSQILDDVTKQKLLEALSTKLDSEGTLRVTASKERSQAANKKIAIEKFIAFIQAALKPKKKRRPTKPSKAARESRLEQKQKKSFKKQTRKKVVLE